MTISRGLKSTKCSGRICIFENIKKSKKMAVKFSYEKSISEIEAIINEIENEGLDVDQLAEKVEHVAELLKKCKQKLTDTKNQVDDMIKNIENK
jgi:exodeoxyribonuclease VII small subunit